MPSASSNDSEFFRICAISGVHPRGRNFRFYLGQLFGDTTFQGARVLDVGGGRGGLTLWAARQGAREAICLEPETDGSSPGMQSAFLRASEALGLGRRAVLRSETLQDFCWDGEPFDLLLLHNSVNHLDEKAASILHRDPQAAERYREIFRYLGRMAAPGAGLLLADCDRHSFWRFMPGGRSPVAPAIEWTKHQTPGRWEELARAGGFQRERLVWTTFNRLGAPGRWLLGNRAAAFMLVNHFALWLRKSPRPEGEHQE